MKYITILSLLISITSLAHATPEEPVWVIRNDLSPGQVEIKVIKKLTVPALRQDLIAQEVVFKKTLTVSEASHFTWKGEENIAPASRLPLTGLPLWTTKQGDWTKEDELAYSHWIASQVDVNFAENSGLLGDCADMGLLFRWVYAHDHQLPIANTLVESGRLFGQFSGSAAWDQLATNADWKKDERFKEAMRYLFDNTNVESVAADLYPTFVNQAWVVPGSMYMILRSSGGHTQTLKSIDPHGITTLWGNEPSTENVRISSITWESTSKHVIGRWRSVRKVETPEGSLWKLASPKEMPGFSNEQFQQGDGVDYKLWVSDHLGLITTDRERLIDLVDAFRINLQMRSEVTAMGTLFCQLTRCTAESSEYSNYSTFSRDARMRSDQTQVLALIQKLGPNDATVIDALERIKKLGSVLLNSNLTHEQIILDPVRLSHLNSDPTRSFASRWGYGVSELTPTLQFLLESDVVYLNLAYRSGRVYEAFYLIAEGADPLSPTIQKLNTVKFDQHFRKEYDRLQTVSSLPTIDAEAKSRVRAYFKNYWFPETRGICGGPQMFCSSDDAVFTDEAKLRIPNWSPDATKSAAERWGFPQPAPHLN